MMPRKFMLTLMTGVLLSVSASISLAQDKPTWKVGDKVEVEDIYTQKWEKATIIEVKSWGAYKARLDNSPPRTEAELLLRPEQVRAPAEDSKTVGDETAQPVDSAGPVKTAMNTGSFKAGDRVIEFDPQGRNYVYRATILEVGDGRYKIQRDGCTKYPMWVDRLALRRAETISANDPEISYLIGKWAMLQPGAPNTVVRGADVYREYGLGGKADFLQINRNGTYVWQYESRTAPVKGRWRTEPKIEEAPAKASDSLKKSEDYSGIIVQDPAGNEWKVYKYVIPEKGKDSIVAAHICQEGNRQIGTRVQ
jgi:hypothetical protein